MNSFTVEWRPDAEDYLGILWLQRPQDRAAINRAQLLIDRLLAADPWKYAIHVAEDLYKIEVSPLAAYYEIDRVQSNVAVKSLAWIG